MDIPVDTELNETNILVRVFSPFYFLEKKGEFLPHQLTSGVSYHPIGHWALWGPFLGDYLKSHHGMEIKREAGFCVYLDTVTMKLYRLFQVSKTLSFEIAQTWNGWSSIVSHPPPKIGQPCVLPKLAKNSLY